MKNAALFIVLVFITLFLYIFFQANFVGFLLIYEMLLLFAMIFLSHFLSRRIKASIVVPYYHAQKNSEFIVEVHLTNMSFLPMPSVKAELVCMNEFTGKEFTMREIAMVRGRDESVLQFYIQAGCCGKLIFGMGHVWVQDYLHLFWVKAKQKEYTDEVMVLPRFLRIPFHNVLFEKDRYAQELYSHTGSGEDTSEVHDVHQYRLGDTIQRVHWKLTAKTNEYFVKEYSMPLERTVYFFIDLYQEGSIEQERYDCFLEVMASLSWSFMKQGIKHLVIWYDYALKEFEICWIESENDIYSMLDKICGSNTYGEPIDIKSLYWKQKEQDRVDCSMLLNIDCQFFKNDVCIKKFNSENTEKELTEWNLEI